MHQKGCIRWLLGTAAVGFVFVKFPVLWSAIFAVSEQAITEHWVADTPKSLAFWALVAYAGIGMLLIAILFPNNNN